MYAKLFLNMITGNPGAFSIFSWGDGAAVYKLIDNLVVV